MTETTMFGRHWQMIEWLSESPEGMTVEELVAKSGKSERTVRRHLVTFREHGVPLAETVRESGQKAYSIAEAESVAFTFDEVVAMYISRRFMEPMMGTFLWKAMNKALTKLRNHLGVPMIRHFERAISVIEPTQFGRGDYQQMVEIIDELNLAVEQKRSVSILYQAAKDSRPTPTHLDPYTLVYNDGSLYLIGHSYKRGQIRVWKIDRISGVTVTNNTFEPPADFVPSEHLRQSFGIFKTDAATPPQTIRIRFLPDYARYVREKHWHATERYNPQPDGSVILEFDFPGLEAVKRWVVQFGCYAEVLEPKELRNMVRKEIELTLVQYRES